jgi:hypothetical protein
VAEISGIGEIVFLPAGQGDERLHERADGHGFRYLVPAGGNQAVRVGSIRTYDRSLE